MAFNLGKIFGWLLLLAGLGIIIWTLYSSYNIFTAKSSLPEFFKIEERKLNSTTPSSKNPESLEEIQKQLGQMIAEELKGIFPIDFLSKIFNAISWSILAVILIFGGSQIAFIGIKLLKN